MTPGSTDTIVRLRCIVQVEVARHTAGSSTVAARWESGGEANGRCGRCKDWSFVSRFEIANQQTESISGSSAGSEGRITHCPPLAPPHSGSDWRVGRQLLLGCVWIALPSTPFHSLDHSSALSWEREDGSSSSSSSSRRRGRGRGRRASRSTSRGSWTGKKKRLRQTRRRGRKRRRKRGERRGSSRTRGEKRRRSSRPRLIRTSR